MKSNTQDIKTFIQNLELNRKDYIIGVLLIIFLCWNLSIQYQLTNKSKRYHSHYDYSENDHTHYKYSLNGHPHYEYSKDSHSHHEYVHDWHQHSRGDIIGLD